LTAAAVIVLALSAVAAADAAIVGAVDTVVVGATVTGPEHAARPNRAPNMPAARLTRVPMTGSWHLRALSAALPSRTTFHRSWRACLSRERRLDESEDLGRPVCGGHGLKRLGRFVLVTARLAGYPVSESGRHEPEVVEYDPVGRATDEKDATSFFIHCHEADARRVPLAAATPTVKFTRGYLAASS
jgi:hypothetical protein